MKSYLNLLREVLEEGTYKGDRTGTGTYSSFGGQIRFDLNEGFPLVTTKRVYWKGVVGELLWFLRGSTNIKYLVDNNIHIWDEWADENGELGPVYGKQWRDFNGEGVDQIKNVIEEIKRNPDSRRLIVSAWNPLEVDNMALPPCHSFFQFYVNDGKLSCQLYQRSADMFLGVPFNIASYSLLTMMVAKECGLELGDFIHTFGDKHIYSNHVEQVKEQLSRETRELPQVELPDGIGIFDYKIEDIVLKNYNPDKPIKAKVAV